jgi:hypothetical protein
MKLATTIIKPISPSTHKISLIKDAMTTLNLSSSKKASSE